MKNYLVISVFLLFSVPAVAYQAGASNRTNFGSGPQQPAKQQQYRSFSNYNTRTWGRGVQTEGVQTNVAGTEVANFEESADTKAPKAPKTAKKQVAAEPAAEKPAAAAAPTPVDPVAEKAPAANAQAAAMPAEAAAMLQQVQGLMGSMAQPQGQAPAGKGNQASPAGGMPDISALMGGMMPQQPQPAPVKK